MERPGYYRRARNLHAAAKILVRRHVGEFPTTAEGWGELPGIGRYTAAAIASIAFSEPVAVLDGNVERVLARLLGGIESKAHSWNAAQQLLEPRRPGDFNQAIMELGATICLPGEPQCQQCAIRRYCRTQGRGKLRSRKPRQLKRSLLYGLAVRNGAVLLVKRSAEEAHMPGMWELPQVRSDSAVNFPVLFRVRHSITITDYSVTVLDVPASLAPEGKWVTPSYVSRLPLTGLARKILCKAKLIQ